MTSIEQNITDLSAEIRLMAEPKMSFEEHSEIWQQKFYVLLEFVFQFCEKEWPRKNIHRFEKQITDCLRWCLGAYRPEKALFIKYLTHSLKMTINNSIKKELQAGFEQVMDVADNFSVTALYKERAILTIKVFEDVFKTRQNRSKEYDSKLITRWLLKALKNLLDEPTILSFLENAIFCDKEMVKNFLQNKYIPTQTEIASFFNRDKTDASREMRKILKKIKS